MFRMEFFPPKNAHLFLQKSKKPIRRCRRAFPNQQRFNGGLHDPDASMLPLDGHPTTGDRFGAGELAARLDWESLTLFALF